MLVNNLPAASLLAARQPPHPFALLIGLNVGPNLFVTGSLAWILWLRAAKAAGGRPDVRRASLLGLASVPLAIAAAVGVLRAERGQLRADGTAVRRSSRPQPCMAMWSVRTVTRMRTSPSRRMG